MLSFLHSFALSVVHSIPNLIFILPSSSPFPSLYIQVKDKESELKSAEQKLHDEFERLRRQNAEEKRQLDDKKRQLVSDYNV